jgi:N-acetylneuraminate synthase
MDSVQIGDKSIGNSDETYIIAEIGSNFDGSKERAKKLIDLAADCGADAAKFQAFKADKIVSEYGFDGLKSGFQQDWDRPVYEVYKDSELPREWIDELAEYTEKQGIDFLCTPYDEEAVDLIEDLVPAYKIGSGDITWHNFLEYVSEKGKPIILATGASTMGEIEQAVDVIKGVGNDDLVLLQCVTNYPSSFESANIRAMNTIEKAFNVPVGYSDHTPGMAVPVGAVSRGGCVIEKHFTDDKSRDGPDHTHSMNPEEFSQMVTAVRRLKDALGDSKKKIYNEEETPVILQRRALRAATDIKSGEEITEEKLKSLRPCPDEALDPSIKTIVIGREATEDIPEGEIISWDSI